MSAAIIVADDIVWETLITKKLITPLQLRHILFLLNLKYLKEAGQPLVTDQKFSKWYFGSAIKVVQSQFADTFYGGKITYIPKWKYLTQDKCNNFQVKEYDFDSQDISPEQDTFIIQNLAQFVNVSGWTMTNWALADPEYQDKTRQFYDLNKSLKYFSKKKII